MKLSTFCLFFSLLLSGATAFGQISEDPEERRNQGQAPLKAQTPTGEPLPFKDRLRFGGGISALNFSPFSIGLSPVVAYQVSEHFVAGLGVGYTYTRFGRQFYGVPITSQQYSGRLFGMYEILPAIVPNLFAHAEISQGSYSIKADGQAVGNSGSAMATLLGATYAQPIGRLFSANLSVLYNFNYTNDLTNQQLYGSSPLVFRILFF